MDYVVQVLERVGFWKTVAEVQTTQVAHALIIGLEMQDPSRPYRTASAAFAAKEQGEDHAD